MTMIKKFLAAITACLYLVAMVPAQATMVQLPAQGFMVPNIWSTGPAPWVFGSGSGNLSSATSQVALIGTVFQKDAAFQNGGTKNIQSISFSTNSRSCTGCTSVVQTTIQTVSTSSGPPAAPSGTILASGNAISTQALSAVVSNGWNTIPNFTTAPTVNYGDKIAIVLQYSSYDSGSMAVAGSNVLYDCGMGVQMNTSSNSGSTWSSGNCNAPIIRINFDDGTVGTLTASQSYMIFQGPLVDTFNSSSTFNEVGLNINLPMNVQIDQLCAGVGTAGTTSTWTLELTDDAATPNVLASVAVDPHTVRQTGAGAANFNQALSCFPIAPVSLTRNTTYHLGILATGAGNITTLSLTYNSAADMETSMGGCGQLCNYSTRKNASWSAATTTKRVYAGVMVSAVDDGTGNGPTNTNKLFLAHPTP